MNVARFRWLSALLTAVNNENFVWLLNIKCRCFCWCIFLSYHFVGSPHWICDIFIRFFLVSRLESKSKMHVHNSINRFLEFIVYSIASISLSFACQVTHENWKESIVFFFSCRNPVVRCIFEHFAWNQKKLDSIMKRYAWWFKPPFCEWYGKLIECKCDINDSKTNKTRSNFMQNQFYNLKWCLLSNMCSIGDLIIIIYWYGTWIRCEWPISDTKPNFTAKTSEKNRIIINSNTDRYQNTKCKAVSVINWCTSCTGYRVPKT